MARFAIAEVVEAACVLERRPFTRRELAAELGVPIEAADVAISNAVATGYLRVTGYRGPFARYLVDGVEARG
jgi:hypothetical protein